MASLAFNGANSANGANISAHQRFDQVDLQRVEWLWPGYIPLGKLSIMQGDPGCGKSLLVTDLAARVSVGKPGPLDDQDQRLEPADVIMISAEDDPEDTLGPRLVAAGADLSRIILLSPRRFLSLSKDFDVLAGCVTDNPEVKLIVIDPISAYLSAFSNYVVRRILMPVCEMLREERIALVGVNHLVKSSSIPSIYRGLGSIGLTAAARSIWQVTKDRYDENRRLVLPVKANLAPDKNGLAFHIAARDGQPFISWEPHPIDEGGQPITPPTKLDEACAFLLQQVEDGPVASEDIRRRASEAGIAHRTLKRAKQKVGVRARQIREDNRVVGWEWYRDNGQADAAPLGTLAHVADCAGGG